MKNKIKYYLVIQLILTTVTIYSQDYKVDYSKLPNPLFEEESPIICILEKDTSLFSALGQYQEFRNKFTCYSSEVITGLKDVLQVEEFNPADKQFQQALKEQLTVDYILDWQSVPDSNGVYRLDIFSTVTNNRIFSKTFYPTVNSNPYEDVKKLLVDGMTPSYSLPSGEIEITATPQTTHFKLIKGDELIREWTGNEAQKTAVGKYRLISEAEKYISQESEVEIVDGQTTSLNIELKPEYASLISVRSIDKNITNVRTDIGDKQVKITYDLVNKSSEEFNIKLEMINKQTGIKSILKMTAGDIDKVKQGNSRVIFWEMLKELGALPSNELQIDISAEKTGGLPWYYYAGGGAALLGGAAVLLLGGGNDTGGENPPAVKIGTPPGRP